MDQALGCREKAQEHLFKSFNSYVCYRVSLDGHPPGSNGMCWCA